MSDDLSMDPAWRLDPLLIACPCRHCSKGRMCRTMAEMFRRCARLDREMLWALRRNADGVEPARKPPADSSWLQVEDT